MKAQGLKYLDIANIRNACPETKNAIFEMIVTIFESGPPLISLDLENLGFETE